MGSPTSILGSSKSSMIDPVQNPGMAGASSGIQGASNTLLQNAGNVPLQQVLGFNPYQQQVMGNFQSFLGAPQASTDFSNQYVNDVLSGKYLNPASNPSLSASADAISSGAQKFLNANLDQLSSSFALSGGADSSALANAKKNATTSVSGDVGRQLAALYGGAYTNERGLQSNAVGQGLGLAQMPYQQYAAALGLGGQQQQMAQAQANAPLQNFQNQQQALLAALTGAGGAFKDISSSYYMPSYAPSQMAQNLGLIFQGMNAAGSLGGGIGKMMAA